MANDYFSFRQFTVRQELCAMKVGTDGTLLGAWASAPLLTPSSNLQTQNSNLKRPAPPLILDIGTGTGLIALMMAQRFPKAAITGIDIDGDAVSQACENVAASPFADRIAIVGGDVRKMASKAITPFDAIVCNPPYFYDSLPSPNAQRTLARHTATLTYRQLMECAWQLLADEGELSVVITSDRKAQMEGEAALAGFFKARQCAVRTTPTKDPRRYLLAFRKHSTPIESAELVIGTDAYRLLTAEFYLQ